MWYYFLILIVALVAFDWWRGWPWVKWVKESMWSL